MKRESEAEKAFQNFLSLFDWTDAPDGMKEWQQKRDRKAWFDAIKWTIEQAEKMSSSRCSGHGMFDDYVALKRLKQLLQGQDDED